MIEPICVTLFPALFLIILFGGGELFRRRNIDIDGEPPISKGIFLSSKYLIVAVWILMVMESWGVNLFFRQAPSPLHEFSLVLWAAGFTLLLIGRFGMGNSFRIGSPKEPTRLIIRGLFRFSRNPMYVGVYTTLVASTLYTLNPIILGIAVFVIVVHHRIVIAEEDHLLKVFGPEYQEYCRRVRRYL